MTRFGEISPSGQHFKSLRQVVESLVIIWQNFEPLLIFLSAVPLKSRKEIHNQLKSFLSKSSIYSSSTTDSVTRFGEISPSGQHFNTLGQLFESLLIIWQNVELYLDIFNAYCLIFIVTNRRILKK